MKRPSQFVLVFVVLISCMHDARGQQCNQCNSQTFGQWYKSAYMWNSVWPKPLIPPARLSVNSMYEAMINNGWRRQNLLGKHHFDADTNQLTEAGKLKVQWILTQTPMHRRDIFVQRGLNETQTAVRIDSIHRYTAAMSPSPGRTNVTDTHLVAEGHSASAVDAMFTGYQANRLPPVLPVDTGGSEESN